MESTIHGKRTVRSEFTLTKYEQSYLGNLLLGLAVNEGVFGYGSFPNANVEASYSRIWTWCLDSGDADEVAHRKAQLKSVLNTGVRMASQGFVWDGLIAEWERGVQSIRLWRYADAPPPNDVDRINDVLDVVRKEFAATPEQIEGTGHRVEAVMNVPGYTIQDIHGTSEEEIRMVGSWANRRLGMELLIEDVIRSGDAAFDPSVQVDSQVLQAEIQLLITLMLYCHATLVAMGVARFKAEGMER